MLTYRSAQARRSNADAIAARIADAVNLATDAGVFDNLPRFALANPIPSASFLICHFAVPIHAGSLDGYLHLGNWHDCTFIAQA